MGKIYYLLGKSASGKDTIYRKLMADDSLGLKGVVLYTTRPRRSGEADGRDYHFIDEKELKRLREENRVIEERTYQTVHGPWTYLTVNDGQLDPEKGSYLIEGVLQSYLSTRAYFGNGVVVPLYIEVEDGERLARALYRERKQEHPKYAEMCRRFLSDQEDFSEEKIKEAGIRQRFQNIDRETCLQEIKEFILENAIHSQTV